MQKIQTANEAIHVEDSVCLVSANFVKTNLDSADLLKPGWNESKFAE
jgi:hypothetical protein